MDAMVKDKKSEINIQMRGCTTLSSSFIGQILKISKKDKVPVSITTDNDALRRFVEDMKIQDYIKVHVS